MIIAILNQPLGNRGDESAHKAFLRTLARRFTDIHFEVIFIVYDSMLVYSFKVSEPNVSYICIGGFKKGWVRVEQAALLLNHISFAYLHPAVRKLAAEIKKCDAVICAPGGICMGGFMNWDHVYQLLLAKNLGKPLMYWGRSIGPFSDEDFKHALFRKYSAQILHYASFISLRDSKSLQIASEMGVHAVSTVDSAFLEVPSATVPGYVTEAIGNGPYMVFVPNSLTWHYRYKNIDQQKIDYFYYKIFDLIKSTHPDWKIVMLPQIYRTDISDYAYFKRLALSYTEKIGSVCGIDVIDESQSSDIQQKIISKSELVIGARYHSIVFAINNARPFVSLSYEHKMSGLLETLGLTQYMVEIQNIFDAGNEDLFDKAVEDVKEKIEIAESTPEKTALAKQIVRSAFETLCVDIKRLKTTESN